MVLTVERAVLSEAVLMEAVGKNLSPGWSIIFGEFSIILWEGFILNMGKDRD